MGSCYKVSASPDSIFTYVFTEPFENSIRLNLHEHVWLDTIGNATIEDLLAGNFDELFRPAANDIYPIGTKVWASIRLSNELESQVSTFIRMFVCTKVYPIYEVSEGKVLHAFERGGGYKKQPDDLLVQTRSIPVVLDPGSTKTFYFRLEVCYTYPGSRLLQINLNPAASEINQRLVQFFMQAFFLGIMLLISIFSIFMFFLFKEKLFIYLAFFLLFLGLYFPTLTNVFHELFLFETGLHYDLSIKIIITGILVFAFLFFSKSLEIQKTSPVLFHIYLFVTVFSEVFSYATYFYTRELMFYNYYHNILILVWILITLYLIVKHVFRKTPGAKNLLVAASFLALGAIINLFVLMNPIPETTLLSSSFQIGTLLFSGFLFYGLFDRVRHIQKERRRIKESGDLKSRFFANISHEFRTPLTLMLGPLKQLIEASKDEKNKGLLQMVMRNAKRQLRLVNQLLDLSKIEEGKLALNAAEYDFMPFVKGVVYAYESLAEQKGISLHFKTSHNTLPVFFDQDKMEKILFNLMSNAFKFTNPGGQITIEVKTDEKTLFVSIKDTGVGISPDNLTRIFDRFFQADPGKNDVQEGSGIGLPLVKELVDLHKGRIEVKSKRGSGSTFMLQFPLGSSHLAPEEVIVAENEEVNYAPEDYLLPDMVPAAMETKTPKKSKLPRILIIEDNDDVRTFIRGRLEPDFILLEANNGEAGIEKALEEMPDLIISDVMMPKRNGYEVCEALKTDIRTSHIPIILLTAKANQSDKLEGLETGADDYLVKPFDSAELKVRVNNLIKSRKQLRQRYAESVSLKPAELTVNSLDQQFLEKALQIVEENMSNEAFSIDILANQLNMSKPNLNRKFRALLNQSSNKFIQSIRMQRAKELIEKQAGTIAEIAFETGFSSTAYFVKCFKNFYGKTPGSMLKSNAD